MLDDFDRGILTDIAHRPWAMPARPWVMTQSWNDLLFAHWPRGTLEHFLTERYCLYTVDHQSHAHRLDIHHRVWPLESAEAEIAVNTMADVAGVRLPAMAPLLHFAGRLDAVCWTPERL